MIVLLVVARILASSWTNVLQKKLAHSGLNPFLIVSATFILLAVFIAPFFAFYSLSGCSPAFWLNMALVILLDVPGNFLLVKSVSLSDLSLIGPINSYKPVVAMVLAVLLLDELPNLQGLAGVAIIVLGSILLAPTAAGREPAAATNWLKDAGARYRLLALVMTASSSIFLKAAIMETSAMHAWLAWAVTGGPAALACLALFARPHLRLVKEMVRKNFTSLSILALLFLLMQLVTLQIFAAMDVAYALALFQLGALVSVFFGWKVFGEKNILPRALAGTIMVAGAVILILA